MVDLLLIELSNVLGFEVILRGRKFVFGNRGIKPPEREMSNHQLCKQKPQSLLFRGLGLFMLNLIEHNQNNPMENTCIFLFDAKS
jgi:hypothetical protein